MKHESVQHLPTTIKNYKREYIYSYSGQALPVQNAYKVKFRGIRITNKIPVVKNSEKSEHRRAVIYVYRFVGDLFPSRTQ